MKKCPVDEHGKYLVNTCTGECNKNCPVLGKECKVINMQEWVKQRLLKRILERGK